MFNLGFSELIVIGAIALIVIGPKQLPEVAKVLGRLIGELKRATEDLSGGLLDATKETREAWKEAQQEVHEAHDKAIAEAQKAIDEVKPNLELETPTEDDDGNTEPTG